MLASFPAVPFCEMAQQKGKPVQLGVRVDPSLKKRLEHFCVSHPWQPTLAFVVEQAITSYLDQKESELPKAAKAKR